MRAAIITAFIDNGLFTGLPAEKRMIAIRTEEYGLVVFTKPLQNMEEMTADLAFELRLIFAVVIVKIIVRGITDRANDLVRDMERLFPSLNRFKRIAVVD